MLKRVVLACLSLTSVTSFATMDSELNHFFNNIGFAANVTKTQTYESQAAGFVALGSVYERNDVRNIQVVHVDSPGFRAGCGGIDLYAGGASFIKGEQIVEFMQSILSNGAGFAMNLALETELPEIGHSLQYMHKLANDVNNMNFNSCTIAENAIGSLASKNRASQQQVCEDIGAHKHDFSDWAMARHQCSTGGKVDEQLEKAKQDPEYKERVLMNTNVAWDALQNNKFIKEDKGLAEVYMSISGTLVFDAKGGVQTYPSLATNPNFVKAILYGGKLPSYRCLDSDSSKCLDIKVDGEQIISAKNSLVMQVQDLLEGIYKNIKEGTALTTAQVGLIEMTQPAAFVLISASAQQNIGIQSVYELSQSVATDLLAQYLANSLGIIRASLSGKDIGLDNEERLYKSVQVAQQFVDRFNEDSRSRFNTALKTNQLVQENVRQALNALNPMLRQAYSGDVK